MKNNILLLFFSLIIIVAKTQTYSNLSFYIVAHQDDWQLFMGANAYNDILNKDEKIVFIYTTSGNSGIIGNIGNGEGYGKCVNCKKPYFKTREDGAISSIQLVNPPSNNIEWCNECWPYPKMSEEKIKFNGKNWYVKKYTYYNTVSYFLRLEDGKLANLKDGPQDGSITVVTSKENSKDHQNTFHTWSEFTTLLNKIIVYEKGTFSSFWINTHEPNTTLNPKDHPDHIATGLACEALSAELNANYIYYVGYDIENRNVNISPDFMVNKAGLLAAYNKPKIDAGWWDDWQPCKHWCSKEYFRIVQNSINTINDTINDDNVCELLNQDRYSISYSINNDKLNLKYNILEDNKIKIEIINSSGVILNQINNENVLSKGQYENVFDITNLNSGLYFIRIFSGGIIMTTAKFIINK